MKQKFSPMQSIHQMMGSVCGYVLNLLVVLLWFKEHKSYKQGLFVSKCQSKQNSNLFS